MVKTVKKNRTKNKKIIIKRRMKAMLKPTMKTLTTNGKIKMIVL